MNFKETNISGNYLIDLDAKYDDRGFFSRFYCEEEFSCRGLKTYWKQGNNSLSKEVGTLRGLHLQRFPYSEVKLIRCVRGEIWDVVVDMRPNSPSFGEWFGASLSQTNGSMMYVPEGCAHGCVSLMPDTEISYLVSCSYNPTAELTLFWNDPDVGIEWPITPRLISQKDSIGQTFLALKSTLGE